MEKIFLQYDAIVKLMLLLGNKYFACCNSQRQTPNLLQRRDQLSDALLLPVVTAVRAVPACATNSKWQF